MGRDRRMSRRCVRKRWYWREIEGARIVIGDIEYCRYPGTLQTRRRLALDYGAHRTVFAEAIAIEDVARELSFLRR